MARGTLTKLKPIESGISKPPLDAVAAGVTPDGHQLYRRPRPVVTKSPRIDPKTGERAWRRDPNGQPLVPLNDYVVSSEDVLFYLEDQQNGNVEMVRYCPPSAEELAAKDRAAKIAAMQAGLAEAAVDAGLTPQEVMARIAGAKAATVTAATAPVVIADLAEYPIHIGGPKWLLSHGENFFGNRADAEKAESKVTDAMRMARVEARAQAASMPEI